MTALQLVQQQERSLDSYVILPGSSRRGREYPDLLVSQNRDYFSKNWYKAHESLTAEGSFMLTPRQFFDFVLALDSRKRIYRGDGKSADASLRNKLLNEIRAKRVPWRAEWLDAYFVAFKGRLYMQSEHRKLPDGRIIPMISEPFEKCLMEDAYVDLESANKQGLPTRKSRSNEVYYWYPRDRTVAWFGVDSDKVRLGCNEDPQLSYPVLGVRPAKIFQGNKD